MFPHNQTTMDVDLILLGEPQVVVGFQQLDVLGQFVDGDWRMAHHSCSGGQGGTGEKVRVIIKLHIIKEHNATENQF